MSRHSFYLTGLVGLFLSITAMGQESKEKLDIGSLSSEYNRLAKEVADLRRAGKPKQALELVEKMLAIDRQIFGKDSQGQPVVLSMFSGIYGELKEYPKAIQFHDRLVEERIKEFGKEHWKVTDARLELVDLKAKSLWTDENHSLSRRALAKYRESQAEMRIGNYQKALQLSVEEMELTRELWGKDHLEVALSLNLAGGLARQSGQYEKAEEYLLLSREIRLKKLGENHPQTATAENNIGIFYAAMGDFAKAEKHLAISLRAKRRLLGDNHPDVATACVNLGFIYQKSADYDTALPLVEFGFTQRKKLLGEEHLETLSAMNNLAMLHQARGEWDKAELHFKRCLELRTKQLGGEHPDVASSLNNLASLEEALGNWPKAESLYLRAREIVTKRLGADHPEAVAIKSNLGNLYLRFDIDKAESLLLETLARNKQRFGETHPEHANSLNSLGVLFHKKREGKKAVGYHTQALTIYREHYGEDHPDTIQAMQNLGAVLSDLGEFRNAIELLKRSTDARLKRHGENHPDYTNSLNNLAAAYSGSGDAETGIRLFRQAVRGMAKHLDQVAAFQSEADQLASVRANRTYLANLLSATAGRPALEAYDLLFQLNGSVTVRQLFLRATRQSKPQVKPLVEELQKVTREMNRLVNNPPDPKLKIDLPKRMGELNGQYEKLQRELASKSDAFAEYQNRRRATAADLQLLLPDDAALIDYVSHKNLLSAFVVTKKEIQRFELGEIKPIEVAIDRFREQLMRVDPLTGKEDDPAVVLREKLWAPLRRAIGNAKLVLICPDGALCRLPFTALPGTDDTKYLIEEVALATMPVPRMLFEILAPRPDKNEAPSLFTMGDVDFDGEGVAVDKEPEAPAFKRRRSGGPLNWPALPGTREEVIAISDSFKAAVPDGKTVTLRGRDATEASIRTRLGQYEFVHLATHGFFSPAEVTAKLRPTQEDEDESRGLRLIAGNRPPLPRPNPGLMSGIVCAGANKSHTGGVLTALDIAELDLTKVELAVLSACETGLGETAGGEGVFGLQRAFQLAGARTTITSLWKVSDGATQKLMTRYYENFFKKNMGTLESLRDTQLWMLREGITRGMVRVDEGEVKATRSPPFFWAAFSLSGDWR